jgi:UDP-glucose 4-epimerase
MTILVTGSAGHLGRSLMRALRATGQAARGIDIRPSEFTDREGRITDRDFVRNSMKGVEAVLHTATLHRPQAASYSYTDFVEVNIRGTLTLLEEAVASGVRSFVYTSTTSAFGAALNPAPGDPAVWVTEDMPCLPRNIYGVTKVAAENLCALFARNHGLPAVVLRTSRFFPQEDQDMEMRGAYSAENQQANELLFRRLDIEDVVSAHLLAIEKATQLGFGRFILSATSPFTEADLALVRNDPAAVLRRFYPDFETLYAARGWTMFQSIDRVYVNRHARHVLGWQPKYDFAHVLECLRANGDFRSPMMRALSRT